LFHDEPTVEVLNQIGLDLSSVGNHEFDKGAAELLRLQNGGCYPRSADGSSGVIGGDTCMNQGRFEGARYQYLAANVIVKASGKPVLPAYAIRDVEGIRIGFIGLTLRGTPAMVIPSGVAGLEFRDEVRTINALVPELKAQGVSVFVVLIHQGGQTTARTALDKSCPGFKGDIVDIADRLDPAVQVVISGHTHQEYVCTRPDGRLITQSGFYGRLLTRIDLKVDRASGAVLSKDANNLVVVNDQPIQVAVGSSPPLPAGYSALAPDPQIAAIVRRNDLPGYDLSLTEAATSREPLLHMVRRDASPAPVEVVKPTAKPKPVSASDEPRGYITEDTLEHLRKHYRGWDFHALHADFRAWLAESADRAPDRYQSAFIGFVKRYHEKNRHQLRA
jgi:5'-nucleotidase